MKTQTKNCPTCGHEFVKLTTHHVLPKRFFNARDFTFELCRDCHTELEAKIIEEEFANQGKKLHEMRYIKIIIRFILDKAVENNSIAEHLDNVIVGLLQSARVYFNSSHSKPAQ